jgi:hypothetical protein
VIHTSHQATCDRCGNAAAPGSQALGAYLEALREKGWKLSGAGRLTCPACSDAESRPDHPAAHGRS